MSQANNDAKHWSRINGWSFPLHFLQLVAWLFILTFALLYFGVLVPNLPTSWQISASVINCLVFLIHVIVHLISVTLNPADPNVRAKNYRGPLPHFDRNQHAHVIENQFCYICEVKVGIQSKHCSACNKCVSGFDHHCKWLNNCIGNRNYRLFVACVSTALVGCLLVLITSCCLVAAFFTPNSWIYSLDKNISGIETATHSPLMTENFNTNETSETATESVEYFSSNKTATEKVFYVFVPVNRILWIVVVIITLVLSLIATGLLTHLLGFHMYLMCIGNSTYEYIIRKRDEELPSSLSPKSQCCFDWNCRGNNLFKKLLSKKANQISPTSNGKDSSADNENEFAMKPNTKNNTNSSRKEGVSIPVLDITTPKDKSSQEKTLENILGNVYLGSPERQRHFLEPIYVNNRKANRTKDMSKRQMETILSGDKTNLSTDESSLQNSSNEKEASSSHGNVSSRKRHPSASPASLLPPIMEMENISSPSLSKWYRSVSAQSLNSLSDTDDLRSYSSLNKDGGAVLPGLALSKRVNSSLSNLLISMEENQENNSDQHDTDDEASGQNYTQSTDTKDSDLYGALVSSSELIVENDEETNDYATQNDSYLSERTEREENDQWADFVSKKKYYSGEDCVSMKPTTRIINEENTADESGKNYPLVSSPRESDFEQFSNERKYNNFFRPVNNSKVIMIGNTKDDGLHEANYFNNQSGNLTNNSEIFDSVVFDTQRSYSNITPIV